MLIKCIVVFVVVGLCLWGVFIGLVFVVEFVVKLVMNWVYLLIFKFGVVYLWLDLFEQFDFKVDYKVFVDVVSGNLDYVKLFELFDCLVWLVNLMVYVKVLVSYVYIVVLIECQVILVVFGNVVYWVYFQVDNFNLEIFYVLKVVGVYLMVCSQVLVGMSVVDNDVLLDVMVMLLVFIDVVVYGQCGYSYMQLQWIVDVWMVIWWYVLVCGWVCVVKCSNFGGLIFDYRLYLFMQQFVFFIDDVFECCVLFVQSEIEIYLCLVVGQVFDLLESGELCVVVLDGQGGWIVYQWVKKVVLLYFCINDNWVVDGGLVGVFDKVLLCFVYGDDVLLQ